jgi:cation diffusion facilitator family transporter
MNMNHDVSHPQLENFRFQRWILLIGFLLFAIKLWAWLLTDSVAVFSDTLESIVNIVAGAIGLYSLYLSAMPRDENHPYGHGKAEFISAAIEGTLISVAAVLIAIKAIANLWHPMHLSELDWGMLLIFITGFTNFVLGRIAISKGRKNKSLALESSGKHLVTDMYSTMGVVLALFIIEISGILWIDTAVSLALSLIIGFMGYTILRKSIAGMMDEADEELLEQILNHINEIRIPDWIDIHNLRVIKYGSILHIDCHLTVPYYYHVNQAHELVDLLERKTREKFGSSMELFVHLDACEEFSCALCVKQDCEFRRESFRTKLDWTVKKISLNQKHRIII